MIRRADVRDVPAIGGIVNDCAERGQMLHRSASFVYEHVRDFFVTADDTGQVVGACGLGVVWANLAEIYALAVTPACRGRGLGRQLVVACLDEARQLGINRIMTLTYEEAFFGRCGFAVVDRQQLPLKVWSQCLQCPKNQACDETAMMLELADVTEVIVPRAEPPAPEAYIVPVTQRIGRPPEFPPEAPPEAPPELPPGPPPTAPS